MIKLIRVESEFEYLSNPKNFPVRQYEMKCKHCPEMVWRKLCYAGKAVCEECKKQRRNKRNKVIHSLKLLAKNKRVEYKYGTNRDTI